MPRCPSCGEEVVLARRCPYCGAEVRLAPEDGEQGGSAGAADGRAAGAGEGAGPVRGFFRGRVEVPPQGGSGAFTGGSESGFGDPGAAGVGPGAGFSSSAEAGKASERQRPSSGKGTLARLVRFLADPKASPVRKLWLLVLMATGLIYSLSPLDLLPDVPGLGWIDDLLLLGFLWRLIRDGLPPGDDL